VGWGNWDLGFFFDLINLWHGGKWEKRREGIKEIREEKEPKDRRKKKGKTKMKKKKMMLCDREEDWDIAFEFSCFFLKLYN